MRIECSGDLVVKAADSEEEQVRLGVEASVLRAVAHPAVVRVTEASPCGTAGGVSRLGLQRVRGTTLVDAVGQPERVIAGWGAAVATVVADLHELGYAHGAIAPDHVLIDEQGRPILCGFGHARRLQDLGRDEARGALEADVRAVARLVLGLLPDGRDGLSRLARRWADGRHGWRGGARGLAKALVERVPDAAVGPLSVGAEAGAASERTEPACVGDGAGAGGAAVRGGGRRGADAGRRGGVGVSVGVAVGVGVAVSVAVGVAVGVAVVVGGLVGHGSSRATGDAPPPHPAPSAGYLLKTVPGEHPVTVVGRWGCGPARPAVLDTRSGSLWTFRAWPTPGASIKGTFIRQVPSAAGLAAVASGAGCDRLVVIRAGQPDMPIAVRGAG